MSDGDGAPHSPNGELPRTAYADAFINARPKDSTTALQTRLRKGAALQDDLASFFSARAAAEQAYAASLYKLARGKPFISDSSALVGGLAGVWEDLEAELVEVAQVHEVLAKRIRDEVEGPLKRASSHGEWGGLRKADEDMGRVVKELEEAQKNVNKAQKKADSTSSRKSSAAVSKLTATQQSYASAQQRFLSSAPAYFTSYQLADSTRLAELKRTVAGWEGVQAEAAQRWAALSDAALARFVSWETDRDVRDWLEQAATGLGLPAIDSGSIAESPALGRSSTTSRDFTPSSPPSTGGGTRTSFATALFSRNRSRSNARDSVYGGPDNGASCPTTVAMPPPPAPNGAGAGAPIRRPSVSSSRTGLERVEENGHAVAGQGGAAAGAAPLVDAEGYSIPPPDRNRNPWDNTGGSTPANLLDDDEDAPASLAPPKLNLDIAPAPVSESAEDSAAALAKVQQSLLAASPGGPTRRSTVLRGRRDVRQTTFSPIPDDMPIAEALQRRQAGQHLNLSPPGSAPTSPPLGTNPFVPPSPAAPFSSEGRTASMTSTTPSVAVTGPLSGFNPFEHTTGSGLRAGITETVNVLLRSGGEVARVLVTGEVHLLYRPASPSLSASATGSTASPRIRLAAFEQLEKAAPNPALLQLLPDAPGEYALDVGALERAPGGQAVVLKYQLHVSPSRTREYVPLDVSTKWRLEPGTQSVILSYTPNAAARLAGGAAGATLTDVSVLLPIPASAVQSKPQGTYSPERKKMHWKLDDLSLSEQTENRILARFTVDNDAPAPSQPAAVRWRVEGRLASDLDVELHPEEGAEGPHALEETVRNTISGKYLASA